MRKMILAFAAFAVAVASAGVFSFEPEGPQPAAKDGTRIYMGGTLNGLNDYFGSYMCAWINLCAEQRHVKLFRNFGVHQAAVQAERLKVTVREVKPDIIAMVLGVDALYYGTGDEPRQRFRDALRVMADVCREAGATLVLVSLPAKHGSEVGSEENKKIAVYAGDMRTFAKERNLSFFDLHRATLEFSPDKVVGNINHLRTAKAFMDLFGIRVSYPHLTADFAADTASMEAPNDVVVKSPGVYEITSPRPPLGFAYCGRQASRWTGLGLKVVNIPADVEKVKIAWTGRNVTVSRTDLEKGLNLMDVEPNWLPYRDATLVALKAIGKPAWNQQVLTWRLPAFEETVTKMEGGRDRRKFFDGLRAKVYASVDRDFDEAEAAVKPVTFTLTFTPVK